MKLWEGRFSKKIDERADDFNSSIAIDSRMYAQDIDGSAAHAAMLADCGIIPKADAEAITAELKKIKKEIADGSLLIDPEAEDIHTFIERTLTERIGDAGKKLHTGRSRNDQVALDLRLYLREECDKTRELLKKLSDALGAKGEEYAGAIMPGYTHMQRAQPITFKIHLDAYVQKLKRDLSRLDDAQKRMNSSPLGCGALAGTTHPIDRAAVARALGFDSVIENTLDGVSDRDFCMELAGVLSIIAVHLSRLCEEITLWCSREFKFVELDDAFATGSSIMPQKKNPDIAELVRGKSGRVFGDLTALLTTMKGLPLAYDKDMQEDKEAIFDAFDSVEACLSVLAPMIATMKAVPENMRRAASEGFINATDCADYLVSKGFPFRDAYKAAGAAVSACVERGETLETLPLGEYKKINELFDEGVYEAIKLENCVKRRGIL